MSRYSTPQPHKQAATTEAARGSMSRTSFMLKQGGDLYEQEADQVAEQAAATQAGRALKGRAVHAVNGGASGAFAPASVTSVLANPGRPLEPALQQQMGRLLGHDFSNVRIHTDEAAVQSTRDAHARAFTIGDDVAFGDRQYAPQTKDGQRLLVHELTHVVQQTRGKRPIIQCQTEFDWQSQQHRGELSEIQGLPMKDLLIRLIPLPKDVVDDEEAARTVGGPRLVTAIRAVKAKADSRAADFLAKNEADLKALPNDQYEAIQAFLVVPYSELDPSRAGAGPPFFGLSPASDAFQGIELSYKVGSLPAAEGGFRFAEIIRSGPYKITLDFGREPGGARSIKFYSVIRTQAGLIGPTNWLEYVVGPDSIEKFIKGVDSYAAAGAVAYMFGPPAPNSIEGAIFVEKVISGEFGEALKAYGRALEESVKDPGWWVQMLTATAGLFRGPGGVPGTPAPKGGAVPQTPRVPSAPPTLRSIPGGGRSLTPPVGNVTSARFAVEGSRALKIEVAPPAAPPAPAPLRVVPPLPATPAPAPPLPSVPGPFIPPHVQSAVVTAMAAGVGKNVQQQPTPVPSPAIEKAPKESEEEPKFYPLYWSPLLPPTPGQRIYVRTPRRERDIQQAQQESLQRKWREVKDPDFKASKYHAHHVVPLYLGGDDDLDANGRTWPARTHLKGHADLRKQPQMMKPPPGLPKRSDDLYDHPVGTMYIFMGFKGDPGAPASLYPNFNEVGAVSPDEYEVP